MAMPKMGDFNLIHVLILVFLIWYVLTPNDLIPASMIDDMGVAVASVVALFSMPTK